MIRELCAVRIVVVCGVLAASGLAGAAQVPSAKLALSFKPTQKDVEYETPDPKDFDKCQVKVERSGKLSGWVVFGPDGQVLRRFVDTNSDNVVDEWRYYNHGLEVYRDIDGDFNNKVDQCRWFHSAGSRWGIDENENGRIDRWKVLSAEEASREAIRALVARDERALKTLLVTEEDLKGLGVNDALSKKILEAVADPGQKMQTALSGSKSITANTQWMRFDSSMPATIPAGDSKATQDLTIYDNAMAIVETDGQPGLVHIGEMVRIGDIWKLTQIPRPLEGQIQITPGLLMQPAIPATAGPAATAGLSPEVQKLLEELQKLDRESPAPTAGAAALATYNEARAGILAKLVERAANDDEREQWTRQLVDGIAHSVQTGSYPDGLKRLKEIEADVRKANRNSDLTAYVSYRRLFSEYSHNLRDGGSGKAQEIQEWWLKELEQFIEDYPNTAETAEALMQLAISHEFSGKIAEARKWYGQVVENHSETMAGTRAAGAVRRLDLNEKPFTFSGPGLKGGTIDARQFRDKVLLVVFWSTWCKPCTEDLPQLRALHQQHGKDGFEILGINLDTTAEPVDRYLQQHRVTWPQVHESGGLMESGPAVNFGIISLPTMFLVDKRGTVVNRNVAVPDLKTLVPELLKK